jgi:uncharacterized protein GlcG (DUF336 family)
VAIGTLDAQSVSNAARSGCRALPSWSELRQALTAARIQSNGGLNLDMWGTLVDRDGIVCAVAFTGKDRDDQWPGSRVISAQKANTANAFSLKGLSLSTANLFTAVQPGGSLFGLQESNPVATDVAYSGNPGNYGQANDPMVGSRIGGVNVFGGGLALYSNDHQILGGIGVSGDTSCADHNIAYRTRHSLQLDYVPGGVSGDNAHKDNIIFDIVYQGGGDATPGPGQMPGVSVSPMPTLSGFGHPSCHGYNAGGNAASAGFAAGLPANR